METVEVEEGTADLARFVEALARREALRRALANAEAELEAAALEWRSALAAQASALDERARALRSAQAAHLAETLVAGAACPVCGSKSHPAPARGAVELEPSALNLAEADARAERARRLREEAANAVERARSGLEIEAAQEANPLVGAGETGPPG